jgi:hypothetical protein
VRHAVFVAYWLSRYVFEEILPDTMKPYLFSLSIRLSQGLPYALGALCLGNLYN